MCALPADEEGNYSRVIRSVRQDAQDNRRWPVWTLPNPTRYFKPYSFFIITVWDSTRANSLACKKREKKVAILWTNQTLDIQESHLPYTDVLRRWHVCSLAQHLTGDGRTARLQLQFCSFSHLSSTLPSPLDAAVTRILVLYSSRTMVSSLLFILIPARAHFRENLLCPWGAPLPARCLYHIIFQSGGFFFPPSAVFRRFVSKIAGY